MAGYFAEPLAAGKTDDYSVTVNTEWLGSEALTSATVIVDSEFVTLNGDGFSGALISFNLTGVKVGDTDIEVEYATATRTECALVTLKVIACDDKTTITVADLNLFYPASANLADEFVQCYIDIVSEADACLVGAGVSDCMIRMLKLNAASYLMYSTGQYDGVKQMRSPTGESVTFSDTQGGTGLNSNQYGRYILMMDKNRCLVNLLESPENERFIVAVGASNYVSSS